MYKLCTLAIIALSGLFTLTACGGAAAPTSQTVSSPRTLTIESICADNPFDSVCVSSIYAAARAQVVSRCTINPAGCSAEVMTCISNPFDEKCVFVAYGEAYESVRNSLVSTCSTGSGASCNTALLTSAGGDDTPSIAACIADPFIPQCIQSNNFAAYRAPHIKACEANFNAASCTLAQAAVCAIGTVAHVNPFSALCTQEDNEYENIRLRHVDACRDETNGNSICTGVTACNTRPFATDCIENTAFVRARRDLIAKCIIGDAVLTNPDCTNAVADGETLTCLTNPYGDDCLAANQLGAAEVQSGGQNDGQSIVTTAQMERLDYCGKTDANAALCGAEVLDALCTATQNPFVPLCLEGEGATKFAPARVTFLEGLCTATQNPFVPACIEGEGATKFAPARVEFVDNCRDANPTPTDCTADIIACNTAPFGDDCKDDTIYDNARIAFAPSCNVAEADRPSGCTADIIACNANPYDADAFDGAGCTRMFFPIPKNLIAFCLADTAWSVGCDMLATNTLSVRRKRAELAGNCLAIDSAGYCDSAINGQTVFSCLQTPYHPDCRGNRAFDQTRIAFCIADTAWDENCDNQAVADSQVLMERTKLAQACVASDTEAYCARLVGVNGQNVFKCNERPLDPDCVNNIAFATIGAKFCVETSPWHEDCDIQATAGSNIRNIRERLAQACEDASAPPCSDTIGGQTVFSCTETPFHPDCVGNIAFNAAKVAYCTATPWHADCDEVGADAALDYAAILADRKLQIATCENADAFPCNRSLGMGDETVFFCKANAFMDACNTNDAYIDIRATFCVGDTAWNTRCDSSSIATQSVRDQRGELAIGCVDATTVDYCGTAIGANGQTVFSCGQDPFHADCAANEAFNKATVEFCKAEATAWDAICDTAAMIDMGDLAVIRASRELHAAKCTGDDSSISYTQPAFCTTEGGGRAFGTETIQTCIVTPFHPDCTNTAGFDAAKTAYCLADTAWESGCNGEPYASNPDVIAKREELARLTCRVLGDFDYCDYPVGGSGQTVHTCLLNPLNDDCAMNPAFDGPREVFCTETSPWNADCDVFADPDTVEGRAVITARRELAEDCADGTNTTAVCSRGLGPGRSLRPADCITTPLATGCVDNPVFADLVAVFCTETNPWHEHCNEQAGAERSLVQAHRKSLVERCSMDSPPAYCTANEVGDTNKTVRFCAQNPLNTDCMANDAFDVLGDVFCTEGNPWHADCNEQAAANPDVLAERKRLAVLCVSSTGYCGLPISVGGRFSVFYCKGDPLHRDCAANDAFDELGAVYCLEGRPWTTRCDDAANPDTEEGRAIIAKRAELALPCIDGGGRVQDCSRRQGSLSVRDCRVKLFHPDCTNLAFDTIREAYCAEKTTFWDTGCDTTDMIGQARIQVVEDCNVVDNKPAYCGVNVNSATGPMLGDCITNPFTTGCEDNVAFDALRFPYCDNNARTWNADCDVFSLTNQDILHKRRNLVKACTGNNQPAYCRRTFSEARYDTTTTVYIVDKGRIRISRLNNKYWVSATPESDYGEGTVVGTKTTITDESGTTDRQIITATTIRSDSGGSYHESNVAIEITVVTSVLREERATITLAECLANPFQAICTHRLHQDSSLLLGPPVAEAAAAFDVYCAKAGNAWKDNCLSNTYASVTRNNNCIANGEISYTDMDIKTIIVADNALFSDTCNRVATISEDINLDNRKKNLSEGDEGYKDPLISVSAERRRAAGRCADVDTRDDCAFIIYYAITAGECVADEDLAGCDNVTSQEGIARVAACKAGTAAKCNENAREAVTVGFCVKNPLDVDCLGERTQLGKDAALCRVDSSSPACDLPVSGGVTIATCIRSPYIKFCRGVRTFFTAFAHIAAEQQTVCVGQGYHDNDFCSKNPQLLTNVITVCRGKGADEAELPGCENIRTQITACEGADDPFNPTGVPDAQGVSCNNAAFDNVLTNHRNNCESDFTDGIRNNNCKNIYDLTCVVDGTGRWVNLDSPLCLGVDDVKSYYREIAFCSLPTTSVHHPACRTVPRNWRTWFDSATTDSSDPNDAIGSVVNGWATDVGDVLNPTPSGFLALPVGSNTIDFTTGRFHLPDTRTHTLTLDSTHVNLPNGGDRSDNDILANSGFQSRGSGSIRHFQGDARDGIVFGRAYKVDQSASASQNRRFYAAILPTTDLGGPVQTSGTATWNGAVSYIRDDGDIIDVAGRGANRNTVNRGVNLSVNFSNRTIDGTFRIDHNNVTSDSEFMLLRMSYNPAGIIRGEVQLGRQPISHPYTRRSVFPDGFRHATGASKLTGIIGSEGAVGVFYTDGVVSQNQRVNHLVGGFVACPTRTVNGSPRCTTNGQ